MDDTEETIEFWPRDFAEEIIEELLDHTEHDKPSDAQQLRAKLNEFYRLSLTMDDINSLLDGLLEVDRLAELIASMNDWPVLFPTGEDRVEDHGLSTR